MVKVSAAALASWYICCRVGLGVDSALSTLMPDISRSTETNCASLMAPSIEGSFGQKLVRSTSIFSEEPLALGDLQRSMRNFKGELIHCWKNLVVEGRYGHRREVELGRMSALRILAQ